jgi:hypothetical protein
LFFDHSILSSRQLFTKLLRKEPQRNSGILILFLTISSCHLGSFSQNFRAQNLKGTVAFGVVVLTFHPVVSAAFTKLHLKEA